MTSQAFLDKIYQVLDGQGYSVTFSLAKSQNYMLFSNGNFIGGLFDEELCLVYTDVVSDLIGHPEPVYCGYSSGAQHKMLIVPPEQWKIAFKLTYSDEFDWSTLVYNMAYTSNGAAVLEDFYNENVVFLRFCYENGLLKRNPLDKLNRIVKTVYIKRDLTVWGNQIFRQLLIEFFSFRDRKGKTSLDVMIKRWLSTMEKDK